MAGSIISVLVDQDHPDPWDPKEEDLFPERIFKKGKPSASEAAKVTSKVLEQMGVVCDLSADEQIMRKCSLLADIGYDGRIYPKITSIPEGRDIDRVFRASRGLPHEPTRVISAREIPQMQIAFFREDDSFEVDPILHYLNLSFSRHAQGRNSSIYQPKAFEVTKRTFEREGKWSLDLATPDEVLVWIMMDRIRGIPTESPEFILSEGLMRLPTRFYGNYASTSFDIHDLLGVVNGEMTKQACDAANWPFAGYGGVVAFKP